MSKAENDCGGAQYAGGLVDTVINHWVNRFLGWKLPKDFAPDAGISFKKDCEHESAHWPVGTNLMTADQAKAMFEYCLGPAVMVNLNGALIDAVAVDVETDVAQHSTYKTHFADDETLARIAALEVENESLRDGWESLANLRQELAKTNDFLQSVANACQEAETEVITLRQQLATARDALESLSLYVAHNGDDWVKRTATKALAAIGEAQPDSAEVKSIPDGWQLVPKEPTEEMISAAIATDWVDLGNDVECVTVDYKAMLAAAPTPAQQPRQESEIAWLRVIDEAMVCSHLGVANPSDTYEEAKKKLNLLICQEAGVNEYFNSQVAAEALEEAAKLYLKDDGDRLMNEYVAEFLRNLAAKKRNGS